MHVSLLHSVPASKFICYVYYVLQFNELSDIQKHEYNNSSVRTLCLMNSPDSI